VRNYVNVELGNYLNASTLMLGNYLNADTIYFGRFRASDVASILAAGAGVQQITPVGDALIIELPQVSVRPLSAYATSELS
jgi:hypothetical protein